MIIGSETLVVIISRSIPLKVGDGDYGFVDWELLVIYAKSVTLGIGVGEQTGLQDRICRWLDTRNKMGGRESSLFNLSKVVLGILVENDSSEWTERKFMVWPDLG